MKKSSKKKTFEKIGNNINSKIPFLMFCAMVVNVFIIYRFEVSRKPQIVYSVERVFVPSNTVPNKVVAPSTNVVNQGFSVDKISSANNFSAGHNLQPIIACRVPYHYFLLGNQVCVEIWGRYFSLGSLTSYGVIRRIFPDRILLDDGSWIVNTVFLNSYGSELKSSSKSNINERVYRL